MKWFIRANFSWAGSEFFTSQNLADPCQYDHTISFHKGLVDKKKSPKIIDLLCLKSDPSRLAIRKSLKTFSGLRTQVVKMRHGRPPKHGRQRDIKRLPSHAALAVSSISESDNSDVTLPSKRPRLSRSHFEPSALPASEDNWQPLTVFDSLKYVAKNDESDIESDASAEDITHSDGLLCAS